MQVGSHARRPYPQVFPKYRNPAQPSETCGGNSHAGWLHSLNPGNSSTIFGFNRHLIVRGATQGSGGTNKRRPQGDLNRLLQKIVDWFLPIVGHLSIKQGKVAVCSKHPTIMGTCINCIAPGSLSATLALILIGALMVAHSERRKLVAVKTQAAPVQSNWSRKAIQPM
jgi:hypothetical protein